MPKIGFLEKLSNTIKLQPGCHNKFPYSVLHFTFARTFFRISAESSVFSVFGRDFRYFLVNVNVSQVLSKLHIFLVLKYKISDLDDLQKYIINLYPLYFAIKYLARKQYFKSYINNNFHFKVYAKSFFKRNLNKNV